MAFVANASQDYAETAPQKFRFAAESPGYLNTGSGSLAFSVLNLRGPFKFIFATGVTNWWVMHLIIMQCMIQPAGPETT